MPTSKNVVGFKNLLGFNLKIVFLMSGLGGIKIQWVIVFPGEGRGGEGDEQIFGWLSQ